MSNRALVFSAALCVVSTALVGCAGKHPQDAFVRTVFEDFRYAGTDATGPLFPSREVPKAFAPGERYIFLLPRDKAAAGGWANLVDRLTHAGAEIVNAPSSGADLANIQVGGPLFKIEFRYGGQRGTIATEMEPRIRSNPDLMKAWMLERFVLQFPQ